MSKTKTITALAIAKDALKLLDAQRIIAETGTYFTQPEEAGYNDSIKKWLNARVPKKPCAVCALGAMFCGLIKNTNGVTFGKRPTAETNGELSAYFSTDQLYLIEECFEGWNDVGKPYRARFTDDDRSDDYSGSERVLRAILNNIIEGKGTFDPSR